VSDGEHSYGWVLPCAAWWSVLVSGPVGPLVLLLVERSSPDAALRRASRAALVFSTSVFVVWGILYFRFFFGGLDGPADPPAGLWWVAVAIGAVWVAVPTWMALRIWRARR